MYCDLMCLCLNERLSTDFFHSSNLLFALTQFSLLDLQETDIYLKCTIEKNVSPYTRDIRLLKQTENFNCILYYSSVINLSRWAGPLDIHKLKCVHTGIGLFPRKFRSEFSPNKYASGWLISNLSPPM